MFGFVGSAGRLLFFLSYLYGLWAHSQYCSICGNLLGLGRIFFLFVRSTAGLLNCDWFYALFRVRGFWVTEVEGFKTARCKNTEAWHNASQGYLDFSIAQAGIHVQVICLCWWVGYFPPGVAFRVSVITATSHGPCLPLVSERFHFRPFLLSLAPSLFQLRAGGVSHNYLHSFTSCPGVLSSLLLC